MLESISTASAEDLSIGQSLALHARQRPSAIAIASGPDCTTYGTLTTQVVQVMQALTEAGLRPGEVVGVEANDRHLHLLVLLACMGLDVATLSLSSFELRPPFNLGRLCDRLVVSGPSEVCDRPVFVMTRGWLARVLASPVTDAALDALERPTAADSIVRLTKSSGTTGVPKVMRTRHEVQQRVWRKSLAFAEPQILPHPDYMCLYQFTFRANSSRAFRTLQLGGTVHFSATDAIWGLLATNVVNCALLLTGDLVRLLQAAPPGLGPFDLYVDVVGAPCPPALRREAETKLSKNICVSYSCNEVNRISVVDENNIGTVLPHVSVLITDDHGEPVAPGEQGRIRVKTDTMTDGYINDPELSRTSFVDGWYLTSDIGFEPSPGKLVVLGRADDLLNIAGLKIAPGPIEERIKLIEQVSDAVVVAITDTIGTSGLLVAVETDFAGRPQQLEQRVTRIVRSYVTEHKLIVLPAFPRTDTGKVRRGAIQDAYRQAAPAL